MNQSNQTLSQSECPFLGPMTGGTTVHLGEFQAVDGRRYGAWLQFGGEIYSSATGASLVGGVWVKAPPRPPSKEPVVVLMPVGGGPRPHYEAAVVIELARCAALFRIEDPWDEMGSVEFSSQVVERMGAVIEASIPDRLGWFTTQWVAASDDPLAMPF